MTPKTYVLSASVISYFALSNSPRYKNLSEGLLVLCLFVNFLGDIIVCGFPYSYSTQFVDMIFFLK